MYTLAAQQQGNDVSGAADTLLSAHNGGRLPAMRGWDAPNVGGLIAGGSAAALAAMVDDWDTARVLPTISQHWTPSVGYEMNPGDTAIANPVSIDDCLSAGGGTTRTRYVQWRQNLGDDLAVLAAEGVPVLLRPWHEAGGGWFWWSDEGPAQYGRLWRDLWSYLVNERGLHNLLWVWSAGLVGIDPAWYPGDDVVDVVGSDRYDVPTGNYSTHYTDLLRFGDSNKVRAMTELGYIPADAAAFTRLPMTWAMTWTGTYITQNSDAALTAFYGSPRVVTRANVRQFIDGTL